MNLALVGAILMSVCGLLAAQHPVSIGQEIDHVLLQFDRVTPLQVGRQTSAANPAANLQELRHELQQQATEAVAQGGMDSSMKDEVLTQILHDMTTIQKGFNDTAMKEKETVDDMITNLSVCELHVQSNGKNLTSIWHAAEAALQVCKAEVVTLKQVKEENCVAAGGADLFTDLPQVSFDLAFVEVVGPNATHEEIIEYLGKRTQRADDVVALAVSEKKAVAAWKESLISQTTKCDEATSNYTAQVQKCAVSEEGFCVSSHDLVSRCQNYEECYNNELEVYEKVKKRLEQEQFEWKMSYEAAENVKCYVGVLQANSSKQGGLLNRCNGVTVNVSHLAVEILAPPPKENCEEVIIDPVCTTTTTTTTTTTISSSVEWAYISNVILPQWQTEAVVHVEDPGKCWNNGGAISTRAVTSTSAITGVRFTPVGINNGGWWDVIVALREKSRGAGLLTHQWNKIGYGARMWGSAKGLYQAYLANGDGPGGTAVAPGGKELKGSAQNPLFPAGTEFEWRLNSDRTRVNYLADGKIFWTPAKPFSDEEEFVLEILLCDGGVSEIAWVTD